MGSHILAHQVTHAAAEAGDNLAMGAKRSIIGRGASCDAPIAPDAVQNFKRPPTVTGLQGLWPPTGAPGAKMAIRPPENGKHLNLLRAANTPPPGSRLPKIQEPRVTKDFPRGKVLRNSSQPD